MYRDHNDNKTREFPRYVDRCLFVSISVILRNVSNNRAMSYSWRRRLRRDFGIRSRDVLRRLYRVSLLSDSMLRSWLFRDLREGGRENVRCMCRVCFRKTGNLIESAVISPARSMYIQMLLTVLSSRGRDRLYGVMSVFSERYRFYNASPKASWPSSISEL